MLDWLASWVAAGTHEEFIASASRREIAVASTRIHSIPNEQHYNARQVIFRSPPPYQYGKTVCIITLRLFYALHNNQIFALRAVKDCLTRSNGAANKIGWDQPHLHLKINKINMNFLFSEDQWSSLQYNKPNKENFSKDFFSRKLWTHRVIRGSCMADGAQCGTREHSRILSKSNGENKGCELRKERKTCVLLSNGHKTISTDWDS